MAGYGRIDRLCRFFSLIGLMCIIELGVPSTLVDISKELVWYAADGVVSTSITADSPAGRRRRAPPPARGHLARCRQSSPAPCAIVCELKLRLAGLKRPSS